MNVYIFKVYVYHTLFQELHKGFYLDKGDNDVVMSYIKGFYVNTGGSDGESSTLLSNKVMKSCLLYFQKMWMMPFNKTHLKLIG